MKLFAWLSWMSCSTEWAPFPSEEKGNLGGIVMRRRGEKFPLVETRMPTPDEQCEAQLYFAIR
ncbi:hypothetical protein [Rhizobium anhuiense]|uniref:hypothetical protein n=1 Tax=Rhizobium anhuiense TaxID=1184720 RepID=UPI00117A0F04|nr:hypothetical protein [Rhizobium anhuiense]